MSRKIEFDGTVIAANQTFPATANWSTWSTVGLTQSLTSGNHTLKVWFDSAAGSHQYINLDNLTITPFGPPPNGVVLSVGYADSATGLLPWQGSPNTLFIGEPPQCCATHGPNNGRPGYDGGAIEISNPTASPVTVNAVTVDFGGNSQPPHFDLWVAVGRKAAPHVAARSGPRHDLDRILQLRHVGSQRRSLSRQQRRRPGCARDAERRHDGLPRRPPNTQQRRCRPRVVPGRRLRAATVHRASQPNAQPPANPVNDLAPSITGVATPESSAERVRRSLEREPPPTIALQWERCDTGGANCQPIAGATAATYVPTVLDVGSTLRVFVTASNATATVTVPSPATAVIQSGPVLHQLGDTSTGQTSVYTVNAGEVRSLLTAVESGTTADFEFFAPGAGDTQTFTPKLYSATNSLLATGSGVVVPKGTDGRWYVATLSGVHLNAGSQYSLGLANSGASGGTYVGSENNGQMTFFVDYAPG